MTITEKQVRKFTGYLTAGEKTAATIEKYRREALRFTDWLAGREVNKTLARAYKEELAEKRTPAGVNGAIAALNCLFAFLGLTDCKLRSVKIQRQIFRDETRELSQAEYRRLLSAAKGKQNERLLLVMETICSTGIRVSELKFFTVETVRRGRADVTNKGKTRTVFLPGRLQKVLLKYAKAQKITAGPVFITRGGRPLDRSNIWADMKRLCQAANVAESKVFPHNLRHLFARTYYDLEKDIVRLADILGHASVNTTRIYTMETGEVHRRQLEKMKLVV
ncbi:MAG: tyrosine-type recombinase/integrase [Oscillibacter sp.]|nr:tyrosine-type recombinase/integrase [Oscillibacter sp.]